MRWAGHAARMGHGRSAYRVRRDLRERDYLQDLGVNGKTVLNKSSRNGIGGSTRRIGFGKGNGNELL
jgi:hypothetical protein